MSRPRLLWWLCGLHPLRVELLAPRRSPPPLAWILLGLGTAALGASLALLTPMMMRGRALAAESATLAQELEHARAGALPRNARGGGKGGEVLPAERASELLRALDRPWAALFDRLEASDDPEVHLVQMAVDAHFTTLQLQAESREFAPLLRYAQRLSAAAPVRHVELSHHEWRDIPGGRVVGATYSVQLDDTPMGGAK